MGDKLALAQIVERAVSLFERHAKGNATA